MVLIVLRLVLVTNDVRQHHFHKQKIYLLRIFSIDPASISAKKGLFSSKQHRSTREPAEKNNRLSRREKCGLITEKSIITVFNICKLFATIIFAVLVGAVVFFVFMHKKHILSLHRSDNKMHPHRNIVLMHFLFAVRWS